jgi:2-keto-4-pentenoate hydratase
MVDAARVSEAIREARRAGRCLDPATVPIGEHEAYDIQALLTQARLAAGEQVVGYKLGYTSEVMRRQMGIAAPNFGPLTDAMLLVDDAVLPPATAPKVEPEIALMLAEHVDGPISADQCREVVAEARLALEVVDSAWCDYAFTWAQNTADGSSAAYVVLGPSLARDDLAGVEVELERNGVPTSRGEGRAAMGDPYQALSWLTHALADRPRRLHRGDVVITGGLCPAVDLRPGDTVTARAGGDQVTVRRAPE